jgi:hypothetical protein
MPIRPLNRAAQQPAPLSFSLLSLACGTRVSASLLSSSTLLLPSAAPHHAVAVHARMGRPGRRACTHAELARAPMTRSRGFSEGEIPLLPLLVMLNGRWPPLAVGHVAAPKKSINGSAFRPSLPLRCLDRAPRPPGPSPSCKPRLTWGFSPFPEFAAMGEEKRGRGKSGGRGKRSRAPRRRRHAVDSEIPST